MKSWHVVNLDGGDNVHVAPYRPDIIAHTLDEDCVCGPKVEPVERDDGSMGWVYTHHCLDGRP